MTNIELHERAVSCAKDFKRSECDLLEAIQRVDEKRVFLELGYSSLHVYVVTELGLSNDQAYNFARVARKSMEVPELKTAIQEGLLNVSTARRIASVIEPENQSEWIGKATKLPQRELEREIAAVNPEKIQRDRIKPVTAQTTELRCSVPKEFEEILKRAQDLESQRTGKPASAGEALVAMGKLYLEKKDPVKKAERNQGKAPAKKKATTTFASRRKVPAHIAHQVVLRDRGQCTHKSNGRRCTETRWLEVHHIQPWAEGGEHNLENLATLCGAHHKTMPGHLHGMGEMGVRT